MSDTSTVRFHVWKESNQYKLMVQLPGDIDSFDVNLPITQQTLEARLNTVRSNLNKIARRMGDKITWSSEEKQSVLAEFAQEGYDAFADWLGESGEAYKIVRSVLEDFPINVVYVHARDFQLPWEVLTRSLDPPLFWGLKYVLHHQLSVNGRTYRPRRERIELEDKVPVELGLLALEDDYFLPAIVRKEVPFFQGLHNDEIICCEIMGPLDPELDKRKELEKLSHFVNRKERHIYHIACHVKQDAQNPSRSCFLITKWFPVSPDDLRREKIEFNGASLIVLNACSTTKLDPFHTSDLVSNLLKNDIQGILATHSEVPDSFASAFAEHFYRQLLEGVEIGNALRFTREHFLAEHNNPLGLLYSLHQISPRWHISKRKIT